MSEREAEALRDLFETILLRHDGDDKKAVAAGMVDLVVQAFDNTEGRIIQ